MPNDRPWSSLEGPSRALLDSINRARHALTDAERDAPVVEPARQATVLRCSPAGIVA